MDQSSKVFDNSFVEMKNVQNQPRLSVANPTSTPNLLPENHTTALNPKAARVRLPKLKTQENFGMQQKIGQQPSIFGTDASPTKLKERSIPPGYEVAEYQKTIQHWNTMSYMNKFLNRNGDEYYENFKVFGDNTDLKQFQHGIYLYLEFIKKLFWTCFIISIILILQLYTNFHSNGLSTYRESFAITLAKFSIGNLNGGNATSYYIESACDVMSMIVLFGFYFHWRSFSHETVEAEERDFKVLDPTMYVVSVTGFDPKTPNLQQQLKIYFRDVYEIEVIYNFKRNFDKFIDLEQCIQQVEKQKQLVQQIMKSNEDLQKYEKELALVEKDIQKISDHFDPIYAIIHFRTLKSKFEFLRLCKRYELIESWWMSFKRCICCTPGLPQHMRFMKKQTLFLKSATLPRPDTINWNNIDISSQSYFLRYILAIIFIAICIFVTSTIISITTLYVTTRSNCFNFDTSMDISTAERLVEQNPNSNVKFCYCSHHISSLDHTINLFCKSLNQEILIANVVQIGASVVSTVTNVLLIVIVSLIAQKLLKPDNKPKQLNFVFISVFISNLINSTFIPLLLNSDIFGFRSVNYLQFVKFIDIKNISIFKDFDRNWFAVISPYYTNFFLIASISPIIEIIVYSLKRKFILWRVKNSCSRDSPQKITIQKQADKIIVGFAFDLPSELAVLCLQFFMCFMYSSLVPLSIPIFTMGLGLTYVCKKYIILNYTVRIPADQSLNQKVINLIPFILLIHGLMGIWARTSLGVFNDDAFLRIIDLSMLNSIILQRATKDIILLIATAVVLIWIIFDFTIVAFFSCLRNACKDEMELPVKLAAIENQRYDIRLRKSNILGSYKLVNHPVYKHPYKAFKQLSNRIHEQKQQQMRRTMTQNFNLKPQPSYPSTLKIQSQQSLMENPSRV